MVHYTYQRESDLAAEVLRNGTVAHHSHFLGVNDKEPLLIMMDFLLRYAKAYRFRYESSLADDWFLGPNWLEAAKGIRCLLNGDGAVAMELDISTDSKDNGVIEAIFWKAMEVAGYSVEDL